MNKLKVNDMVKVISGSNLGQTGKIVKVDFKNSKVWVDGVNLKKVAVKRSQENVQGGFSEKLCPLHISNVAFFDSAKGQISKVGIKKDDKSKNVRFLKKSNVTIK